MPVQSESLALFHPLIAAWFRDHVGVPTDVQAAAWPRIAVGEHVLITAPTGSGKTLTAFLWALNQLVTGELPNGQCSVVYISPLKALNNDIQRNLLRPLQELRQYFEDNDTPFPNIRVLTRSGDTTPAARQAMLRRPPEILITTPESLNLLLSSKGGVSMISTVRTVLLDEIHAVIDTKRGTYLMTGVERLARIAGEFQRIALSATIRPLDLVASFIGGYQRISGETYQPRAVSLVRSTAHKSYQVQVRYPERELSDEGVQSIWPPLIRECKDIIERNRSTLIFANARRLAETITWKINADAPELLAYAHHGSLAREIRSEVEHRLKAGRLRAIVATNSLEMGIDIGALDEVVLIQSPPSVSSAIQRVGRAGHQVGEVSRATLFPTHPQDLLRATVLARGIMQQKIEQARVVRCPLDVLSQVIVSMTGMESWDIDELFAELRCSYAFHTLTRQQFDLVLQMLAGRYAETRIRELNARISIDGIDNTVVARPGALQAVYMSGGVIPDRGAYHLRLQESGAHIGELDEEYVWEASVGQQMTFGTQNWQIERITHNDVFVRPSEHPGRATPFWLGEELIRNAYFSEQVALFMEEASARLDDPEFSLTLQQDYCLSSEAAEELLTFLRRQRNQSGCELPHRHHLLVEHVASGPDGYDGNQVILHTFWGGGVNRPFALALSAAWDERYGEQLQIYSTDDAIYLMMTGDISADELLSLVTTDRLENLLREKLEGSGFFGARFRECAGRALLLTRRNIHERMPLWVNRLRAKKLLDAVQRYGDFPMVLEAWRTCLCDEFDLDTLHTLLAECATGEIRYSEVHLDAPSPLAQEASWRQINQYMYMDDTPSGRVSSRLRPDLLHEVVFSPELRPSVAPEIIKEFIAKRQRTAPGYSPQSARELLDWVKERLFIQLAEWDSLLQAMQHDHGVQRDAVLAENSGKLATVRASDSATPLIVAVEYLPRLCAIWDDETLFINSLPGEALPVPCIDVSDETNSAPLLGEWLRFYGPITAIEISATFGLPPARVTMLLDDLLETQNVVCGQLTTGEDEDAYCDSENYASLLRIARAAARPIFTPLPCEMLPLFLAQQQGICQPGERIEELATRLEQLRAYPARVELWEEAILPARLQHYETSWLDSLTQQGGLQWVGMGKQQIGFCLEEDLPLPLHTDGMPDDLLSDLLPDPDVRYPLHSLTMKSGQTMHDLVTRLWDGVWSGIIGNDSMAALRRGITNGFQSPKLPEITPEQRRRRHVPRGGFSRWANTTPFAGNWYRLPEPLDDDDLIEVEERAKDRARILLDRYGIVFRELLQWEIPVFQWSSVFRALRLLELSGEVLTGCFFNDIPGLQFISHQAFRALQRSLPNDVVWWMNACDPASCCGIRLTPLKSRLPRRVANNTVVFRGSDPVLLLLRGGKELQFQTTPDDSALAQYLAPITVMLERRFQPVLRLTIEAINGENPCESPYLQTLMRYFHVVRDMNRIFLAALR